MIVCENTAMERILLVKTSSLGDVIHNLPVVTDILQQHPSVKIDWVAEESFADIPRLHPAVDQVFTVAVRRWRKTLFNRKTWQEISAFKRAVSKQHYDLVIDTQGLIKSALMASCAQGLKCGQDNKTAREPVASYFYQKKLTIARNQHAVVRNRETVAKACGFSVPNQAPDYGLNAKSSNTIELPTAYIIGLHGTSKDSKLWPTNNWLGLAAALNQQQLHLVLPWASDAEHKRAKEIAASNKNVIVLPKLSIAQLAPIIGNAKAAVGVDTGLSHLATALSLPTVAIYTDTKPALTGVYPGAHAPAKNLGGKAQCPSVEEVISTLNTFKS